MASKGIVDAIQQAEASENEHEQISIHDDEKPPSRGVTETTSGTSERHDAVAPPPDSSNDTIDSSKCYSNNLMWQVGLLELTNALDFPANVWNQIPIPLFAQVLMAIGGSIAILWSIFPFWDMHKSLANIRLLREERRFLKQWQQELDEKDTLETCSLVQAWLDVNFRELGWECIDRVFMDVCAGISGILVGTGALMAIRGDIDAVFQASNLLSGYIGNSFLAPFALVNSFWAVFMWIRAGGERKLLSRSKIQIDSGLQARMRRHGRKHRLYAVVNGLTAVVGTVGSIMSATLWYGYVVIAPVVFTAVFSNLFWRYKMGYNRRMIKRRADLQDFDLLHTLQAVQTAIDAARTGTVDTLLDDTTKVDAVDEYMARLGLRQATICRLDEVHSAASMISIARATIIAEQNGILRDQERFLIEVYGRYFRSLENAANWHAPKT